MDLCEKCQNKDTRQLQDNFNAIFLTMSKVAEALNIEEDDWKQRMETIGKWASEIITKRMEPKKNRPHESGKEVKHTKYEKGISNE